MKSLASVKLHKLNARRDGGSLALRTVWHISV